jgi:hypothetical protein
MSPSSSTVSSRFAHVTLVDPASTFIAPDVDAARIAPGSVIHPGCRLSGATLSIGPGCILGEEGPLTVRDCQLGARVRLGGGFFDHATLLDDVSGGNDAHVRPGCLFEEAVTFGHAAGFKQTILLPFVTTGSLINFCDCLMAGGTSRRNHSEVGSSFVHFNYTPHQDKATASLIGDVAHGVRLDQAPIFLGGQGGLVGPIRIAYGTVLAAGQITRRDVTQADRLILAPGGSPIDRPHAPGRRSGLGRVVASNLIYIGNLLALDQWYRHVRVPRLAGAPWQAACCMGALSRLSEACEERLKRLDELVASVAARPDADASGSRLAAGWPAIRHALADHIAARTRTPAPAWAVAALQIIPDGDYLRGVQSLPAEVKSAITAGLQSRVDDVASLWQV